MSHYSENEVKFFNQLLLDYDIRIDGRDKMELRNHEITYNIINTCLSSVKISYNNSNNEIIFAVKGEVVYSSNVEEGGLININIDSMQQVNDSSKAKNQIEKLITTMLIANTSTEGLKVQNSKPEMIWKIFIDIFVFDELKLSLLQLISIGVREALINIKVPKIVTFYNEITKEYEYDLQSNYEEMPQNEEEYQIDINPPEMYCFSVMQNMLYLDPLDEEWDISNCIIFISEKDKEILQVESIGENINPLVVLELGKMIKNI